MFQASKYRSSLPKIRFIRHSTRDITTPRLRNIFGVRCFRLISSNEVCNRQQFKYRLCDSITGPNDEIVAHVSQHSATVHFAVHFEPNVVIGGGRSAETSGSQLFHVTAFQRTLRGECFLQQFSSQLFEFHLSSSVSFDRHRTRLVAPLCVHRTCPFPARCLASVPAISAAMARLIRGQCLHGYVEMTQYRLLRTNDKFLRSLGPLVPPLRTENLIGAVIWLTRS